jgi:recombination protein RecA
MIEERVESSDSAKDKAIEQAVKAIEKEYGTGSIIRMDKRPVKLPCIPTGLYDLDNRVLGCGGLPKGRIVEIYGAEASSKTTICLTAVASAQSANERAAYIDTEHSLSPDWMKTIGVNIDDLLVSQPDYGEQALDIVGTLVESSAFGIIIVDSVAALVPKSELDGEFGEAHMALQARLMSQAMRKLSPVVSKSGCVLVFVNQTRSNIGSMGYGSPDVTTGGRALRFYSSVRLQSSRVSTIKSGEEPVGIQVKIVAKKNKMSAPFREVTVPMMFDIGFDKVGHLIDVAAEKGIVTKAGSWFSYAGNKWQGRDAARAYFNTRERLDTLLQEVQNAG